MKHFSEREVVASESTPIGVDHRNRNFPYPTLQIACVTLFVAALLLPIATVEVSIGQTIEDMLDQSGIALTLVEVRELLKFIRIEIPEDQISTYNVLQTVTILVNNGHFLAGSAVAIGCILLPILKLVLMFGIGNSAGKHLRSIPARLSMLDVFVVAVLVVSVSTVPGWSVVPGPAIIAYVVFTVALAFVPIAGVRGAVT